MTRAYFIEIKKLCFVKFLFFSLSWFQHKTATLLILQITQAYLTAEKNIGSVYFASKKAKALLELFFLEPKTIG